MKILEIDVTCSMNIKECLYNKCEEFINDRFQTIQYSINEIQKSLLSETKSSAGDKHETGRAMLQLEREKVGQQLAEINKIKAVLTKVSVEKQSEVVSLGSVVYTTQLNYFVAISAGEIKVENESFFAISANTPIGQILLSKTIGDTVSFRDQNIQILRIE